MKFLNEVYPNKFPIVYNLCKGSELSNQENRNCSDSPKNIKSKVTNDEVTNQSIMSARSRKRQDCVMVRRTRKFEGRATHGT